MALIHAVGRALSLPVNPRSPFPLSLSQLVVFVVVMVLLTPPQAQGFGVCRSSFRCLNGGEERYGQSIFGPCRCRCRHGYTGPRCQYREVTRKRSNSLNVLNDFLQARLQAERQQQQEEEAFTSSDNDDVPPTERRRRSMIRIVSRLLHR